MADGVVRFRRKPEQNIYDGAVAARFGPDRLLVDLLAVAKMAGDESELAVAEFADGPVLLARYLRFYDEHPARIEFVTVQPGQWLAYSAGEGFLYQSTDEDWAQFYDRAESP